MVLAEAIPGSKFELALVFSRWYLLGQKVYWFWASGLIETHPDVSSGVYIAICSKFVEKGIFIRKAIIVDCCATDNELVGAVYPLKDLEFSLHLEDLCQLFDLSVRELLKVKLAHSGQLCLTQKQLVIQDS